MAARPFSRRTFLKTTAAAAAAGPLASVARPRRADAAEVLVHYVAPDGNDRGPGSALRPFRTMRRARQAVLEYKRVFPVGDITVYFRQGTYPFSEPAVFGVEDSGNARQTITYAAYPGERPVFNAAAPLTGWRPLSTPPPGLPAEAAGRVWVADVPAGRRFKTLYEGGRTLPVARSDGFTPNGVFPITEQTRDNITRLEYPEDADPWVASSWDSVTDIELLLMPTASWMVNILPLASLDRANRVARTQVPGRYPLGRATNASPSAWVQNAIGCLNAPGEWVLNSRDGKVLYWPATGRPRDVRAPVLKQLIRVQGNIHPDEQVDHPVTHLVFRGLTFTGGDRDTWPADYRGRDLQHAWDLYDRDNALVQFRGAEDCRIVNCEFTHSGHNAIRCDLHCQRVEVTGNLIHDVGATGILFAGYGPGTKDVNRDNVVRNNEVHTTGTQYWHGLGIWLWQSGRNRVESNLVRDTPYTGVAVSGRIAFTRANLEAECAQTVRWTEITGPVGDRYLHGRDNIVERNDVSRVMTSPVRDGNGIYVSGTAIGNIIRRNYIHDIDGSGLQAGYRTDDAQFGTLFEENVICRTKGHFGMVLKQRNDMVNNVVADLDLDRTDLESAYLLLRIGPVEGSRLQRNIYYSTRRGQRVVQEGPSYNPPDDPQLKDTDCDFNDYFCTVDPGWGTAHLQAFRPDVEQHSLAVDPRFYDAARSDFRLRPGSPMLPLGFKQIDMLPIGPTADFPYANPADRLDRLFVRSGEQFAALRLAVPGVAALAVHGRTERGYVADLRGASVAYSIDNAVASVTSQGLVFARRAGTARITVTATKGDVTKSTSIVVIVGSARS